MCGRELRKREKGFGNRWRRMEVLEIGKETLGRVGEVGGRVMEERDQLLEKGGKQLMQKGKIDLDQRD